jgi:hypothetical protein
MMPVMGAMLALLASTAGLSQDRGDAPPWLDASVRGFDP